MNWNFYWAAQATPSARLVQAVSDLRKSISASVSTLPVEEPQTRLSSARQPALTMLQIRVSEPETRVCRPIDEFDRP